MEASQAMDTLDRTAAASTEDASRTTARRTVLAGASLAAGVTLLPQAAKAADAMTYAAAHHHGARLLGTRSRHLVGRFAYGVTPGLATQVRHHGGAQKWFEW